MAMGRSSQGTDWTKFLGFGTVGVAIAYFSLPTLVILVPGMLPTAVARVCDRTEQKYATFCVGGMNLCGVFPYLLHLWTINHDVKAAIGIISDIFALVVMYSAAGFGWLMFMAIPPVVSAFLNVLAQRRVTLLRASQEEIVKEWGPEVAMPDDD
jgi:hypothetical protein